MQNIKHITEHKCELDKYKINLKLKMNHYAFRAMGEIKIQKN
jgi:hypothetical protein